MVHRTVVVDCRRLGLDKAGPPPQTTEGNPKGHQQDDLELLGSLEIIFRCRNISGFSSVYLRLYLVVDQDVDKTAKPTQHSRQHALNR